MLMSVSVIAKNDVIKVYDKGQDGGMRIYSIVCPNGEKTSVTKMINTSGEDQNLQKQQQTVKPDSNLKKEGRSIKSTAQNLKEKALKLIGQENRAEVCLYPVDAERKCKTYKNIDAAAKAACDLMG